MNLPDRDEIVRWMMAAPPTVLLMVCVGLSGWVWALDAQMADHAAMVAVATEQADATQRSQVSLDRRLARLEAKMDVMMELLVDMRATVRRIDKDQEKTK